MPKNLLRKKKKKKQLQKVYQSTSEDTVPTV